MVGMGVLSKLAVKAAKTALKDAPYFPPGSPERAANLAKLMEGAYLTDPVFHGTQGDDFSSFAAKKLGVNTQHPFSKLGHYFGAHPDVADIFARSPWAGKAYFPGARIIPAHLAVKKPYEMGWRDFSLQAKASTNMPKTKSNRAVADFKAQLLSDGYDGMRIEGGWKPGQFLGSDEWAHDNYVAFDPGQIKSIFNRGTFDRKNPDMLKARGGRVSSFAVRR